MTCNVFGAISFYFDAMFRLSHLFLILFDSIVSFLSHLQCVRALYSINPTHSVGVVRVI